MKLKYPLEIVDGALAIAQDYPERVAQGILSAVLTYQEERVMRTTYGITTRPFDIPDVPRVLADIRQAIASGIGYPDVTFTLQGSLNEDGSLDIRVLWEAPNVAPQALDTTISLG